MSRHGLADDAARHTHLLNWIEVFGRVMSIAKCTYVRKHTIVPRFGGGVWAMHNFTFNTAPRALCLRMQSTLRPPEVHIRTIHFNVNARFVWRLWVLMICMPCTWGQKYDMHAVHVGAKIVHVYVQL